MVAKTIDDDFGGGFGKKFQSGTAAGTLRDVWIHLVDKQANEIIGNDRGSHDVGQGVCIGWVEFNVLSGR